MSWGLVLSGGGACGIANVGVLEVLEDAGLRPDCLAGSSMGAIVAAVYARGHPVSRIKEVVSALDHLNIASISKVPLRGGLHGGLLRQRIEEHLRPLVGDATLGECEIPFVCVAGRVQEPIRWERALLGGFAEHVLERVEPWVFPQETPIVDAVMASSAIPVLFSPAEVDGAQYIDLLHFGAIPARTLRREHEPAVVIATDTMPDYEGLTRILPPGLKELMEAGYAEADASRDAADILVSPALSAAPYRFDQGDAFTAAGREAMLARLEEVKRLVVRSAAERTP